MDDPGIDPGSLRRAFRALSRVHRLSRTGVRMHRALDRIATIVPRQHPVRVLDVACGGGDAALDAAKWGVLRGREVEVVAVDRSAVALEVVAERARQQGLRVDCREADACQALPEGTFHLAFSSLFLHHLGGDDVVRVLRECAARSRFIVMEDLRRSRVGLFLAHATLRLVSRSRIAWHDGPASVRAGWSREELERAALDAGMEGASVRWGWPERWILEWSAE